jgi:hypothetical protein
MPGLVKPGVSAIKLLILLRIYNYPTALRDLGQAAMAALTSDCIMRRTTLCSLREEA